MKHALVFLSLFYLSSFLTAQTTTFQTVQKLSGPTNEEVSRSKLDSDGNLVICGTTESILLQLDSMLVGGSSGQEDAFLIKQDVQGNWLWSKFIGGLANDLSYGLEIDDANEILFAGHSLGLNIPIDFEGQTYGGTGFHGIMTRISPNGYTHWIHHVRSTESFTIHGVGTDQWRNVYFAGTLQAPITINGIAYGHTDSQEEIFLMKMDYFGNVQWFQAGEGNGTIERISEIAVSELGDVYMVGTMFGDSLSFGGQSLYKTNNQAAPDGFLLKVNEMGNVVWTKSYGGDAFEDGTAIGLDEDGDLYVAGHTNSSIFQVDDQNVMPAGNGSLDAFVMKFDPAGAIQWLELVGGSGNEILYDLQVGGADVYLTGAFDSPIFPLGGINYPNQGQLDAFIVQLDANSGDADDAAVAGNSGNENGSAIEINQSGNVIWIGNFDSPQLTLPGFSISNDGMMDIFIAELGFAWATHIEDPSLLGLKLYPQPAQDYLMIELPLSWRGQSINLTLYDLSGKMVFTDQWMHHSETIKLDRNGHISTGLYQYVLKAGDSVQSGKVLFN